MRLFRLAFVCVQFVWLGVVVPAHTPGALAPHEPGNVPACCITRHAAGHDAPADRPTESQRERCPICAFVAHLIVPPAFDVRLAELGLRELLPLPPPAVAPTLAYPPAYLPCGPPVYAHV